MSKLDEKFIVKLQGKEFVLYNGLVDLAHQLGFTGISTELIQIPTKENDMTCIVKAVAKIQDQEYHGIGDASPGSVSKMLVPHIIRMAETRAKARALRDLTNVGMTAVEEMIDEDDSLNRNENKNINTKRNTKKEPDSDLVCSKCSASINQAVQAFSTNKFGKALCMDCQKKQR